MKRVYNLIEEKVQNVPYATFNVNTSLLPSSIDLRSKCPPVYDQGTLGSCTSNAALACVEFIDPTFRGSRLFHYWNERSIDGTTDRDAGSSIGRSIEVLKNIGVCAESLWGYDIRKFTVKPTDECFQKALLHKVVEAELVPMDSIKSCLYGGFPIDLGIKIYSSFESSYTGKISIPKNDEKYLGNHAVLIVGYNDTDSNWICRNSWGSYWGDKGYFYLPYDYLNGRVVSDLWKITKVTTTPNDTSDDVKPVSSCKCVVL